MSGRPTQLCRQTMSTRRDGHERRRAHLIGVCSLSPARAPAADGVAPAAKDVALGSLSARPGARSELHNAMGALSCVEACWKRQMWQ